MYETVYRRTRTGMQKVYKSFFRRIRAGMHMFYGKPFFSISKQLTYYEQIRKKAQYSGFISLTSFTCRRMSEHEADRC